MLDTLISKSVCKRNFSMIAFAICMIKQNGYHVLQERLLSNSNTSPSSLFLYRLSIHKMSISKIRSLGPLNFQNPHKNNTKNIQFIPKWSLQLLRSNFDRIILGHRFWSKIPIQILVQNTCP